MLAGIEAFTAAIETFGKLGEQVEKLLVVALQLLYALMQL